MTEIIIEACLLCTWLAYDIQGCLKAYAVLNWLFAIVVILGIAAFLLFGRLISPPAIRTPATGQVRIERCWEMVAVALLIWGHGWSGLVALGAQRVALFIGDQVEKRMR